MRDDDGLGDLAVHARGAAALAVFRHDVGRERDDGQTPRAAVRLLRALCTGRGEAVHFGHFDVHQHQIEVALLDALEPGAAVRRGLHVDAHTPEERGGELAIATGAPEHAAFVAEVRRRADCEAAPALAEWLEARVAEGV